MRIVASPSFSVVRQTISLPVSLVKDFMDLKGHYFAASIAFYAFMSLFPWTIATITVLQLTLGQTSVHDVIADTLASQIPVLDAGPEPSFVANFVSEAAAKPALTSSISGLVLFISALGVFGAIMNGINIMWGVKKGPGFFRQKCTEAILMVVASILLFASLVISASYSFIDEISVLIWEDAREIGGLLFDAICVGAPFGISFIVFATVFRWLPQTKVEFRDIVPICLITAIAFELAKFAFIYYLQNGSERFLTIYGSVATLMMFFIFIYVQAIILLAGAMLCSKWIAFLRKASAKNRGATKRRSRRVSARAH